MTQQFSSDHWRMRQEARYAQRLCERTARLYRRLHTLTTFASVLGGSAALTAAAAWAPTWMPVAGALVLALAGAAGLALRPAERAAANDTDVRKYAQLLLEAPGLSEAALAEALAKARLNDGPEVEGLRDVAYNDMVREVGRPDLAAPLSRPQRLLAALA